MLLKMLDLLECPKCSQTSRLWKLSGELTDSRITNGKVICPNDHSWRVMEEILRFDKIDSDEEMEFLDHPRTGFPKEVNEDERFEFLTTASKIIKSLEIDENALIKIRGNSILFFKFMNDYENKFVIIHPNEGILRQLQESAARKQMYDKMSFIKAHNANLIGPIFSINLFEKYDISDSITISLDSEAEGVIKWQGSHSMLKLKIH